MKSLLLVTSALGLAFAAPAFAAEKATYETKTKVSQDKDGDYKKVVKEEAKDASGKATTETTTKIDGENGDKSVETEIVKDPKGLMNKTTKDIKMETEHKDNGKVVHSKKVTVDGKTTENTKTEAPVAAH